MIKMTKTIGWHGNIIFLETFASILFYEFLKILLIYFFHIELWTNP
jgi:hypothetical protein